MYLVEYFYVCNVKLKKYLNCYVGKLPCICYSCIFYFRFY